MSDFEISLQSFRSFVKVRDTFDLGAHLSGCLGRMGVTGCMEIGSVLRFAIRAGRLLFLLFLALAWIKEFFTDVSLYLDGRCWMSRMFD